MESPAMCADRARRRRRHRHSSSVITSTSSSSRDAAACTRRPAAWLAPTVSDDAAGINTTAAAALNEGRAGARCPSSRRAAVAAMAIGLAALAGGPVASAASAGGSHSCVLFTEGLVKCWGENYHGQLGQNDEVVRGKDNSTMGDQLPFVPLGEFPSVFVDSGGEFNCALNAAGDIKCWGRNEYGQLGLEDNITRGGPTTAYDMGVNLTVVDLGTGVVAEQVALGGMHACAVVNGGNLKCWGRNDKGQLGLNDTLSRGDDAGEMGDGLPFVDIGTDVVVTSVALGEAHTCAVIGDGDVKCWGNNDGGQLGYEDALPRGTGTGDGLMGNSLPVVDLGRDQKAIAVAAGFFHTCAMLYTGVVKCWGFGSSGQLGQGNNASIGNAANTMGDNLLPVALGTARTAVAVALGATHSCAALDDGTLKCWGGNERGSLGLGDTINRGALVGEMGDNLLPVALTFGSSGGLVSNVFAGRYHTCVSGATGGLACFGINNGGQLGAQTDDTALGDEANEVEGITAISLGSGARLVPQPAPGDGIALQTISPTPVPTPLTDSDSTATRAPVVGMPGAGVTPAPSSAGAGGSRDSPAPDVEETGGSTNDGDGDDGGGTAMVAGIAAAAVLIPLVALGALFCCWRRRRKRKEGEFKSGSRTAVSGAGGAGGSRDYVRDDSFTSSENNAEANGDGGLDSLSSKPLVKAHALQSTAPMNHGHGLMNQGSAETLENSSEGLPRPPATTAGTAAGAAAAGVAAAGAAAAGVAAGAAGYSDDEDDASSRDESSATSENPSELRRSGSGSSISTLGSTSTASSTWPSDGFMTPARTDVARGVGGRYGGPGGGRGKAGSSGSVTGGGVAGLDGLPPGFRTPAHRGAATSTIPETPSPRSVSSSVHGTPAPPEMRLAQFARTGRGGGAGGADTNLYGVPEMEIGRSKSNVFDSNPVSTSWPVGSKSGPSLTAGSIAAAAAAGKAGGGIAGDNGGDASPDNSTSPTMGPTLTPSRARHRGDAGDVEAGNRKSNRSSRTSTASPAGGVDSSGWDGGGGGMGAEAAAQAFTEEAELEALQIDKNDLKLVFGRPFARGKSSEVYQVTHAGKNRAAKIIDLFSLGVVGEEVTRLYASFAQELRAMKGIRHDCVAAVYGAVATPSELTIVTDLVKRGPLRTLLTDKKKREGLTPTIRHRIIKDVARGMAYLSEQGVQHRNLHSHNVLITKEWGAKVADYGLARTSEVMLGAHDRAKNGGQTSKKRRRPSPTTLRAGTLRWMAPELLQPAADGVDPFTEASDVYSVGVIAWEVLCGGSTLPYDGLPDNKVTSMILEGSTPPVSMETPLVYNKLMLLCWRKNPASRPTFSHMASVLLKDEPPPLKASP